MSKLIKYLNSNMKKIWIELEQLQFHDSTIRTIFQLGRDEKLNEFEIVVMIAKIKSEQLENVIEDYKKYMESDTRPINVPESSILVPAFTKK